MESGSYSTKAVSNPLLGDLAMSQLSPASDSTLVVDSDGHPRRIGKRARAHRIPMLDGAPPLSGVFRSQGTP